VKLRVPLLARLGALVVATTGFYTYVGQMVPQKEVYPPKEVLIKADVSTAEMTTIGKEIFEGKGLCTTCHTIGKKAGPYRFPDLDNIAVRAKTREPGLSDVDYFAQTMYDPDVFIVPGFNPGMPAINKPPIGLTDQEILCVMAYLQSLGGTPNVTLATKHHYNGGGAAAVATGATAP
jgi:mono/diheme cytochrome c family protein